MTAHPLLYQINTRTWLTELAATLGRPATLDDAPDETLDRLAASGFDWLWLLGVWRTGAAGRSISRTHPSWQDSFRRALPDLSEEDICGSCFAIHDYTVAESLGGAAALARFRNRLRQRGIRLMLDFVPNHMAPDHPWIETHPEFFIQGPATAVADAPDSYFRVETARGPLVLAYGRDPFFPGWPDTVQLDYANPDLQEAMRAVLAAIANQCDGVRCDMAMLVLPEVFEETWRRRPEPFWPEAIASVRRDHPGFVFLAEVYWKEWELLQQGFDYAYDKRLYDRLRDQQAGPVRAHLVADVDYQARMARFLENHDEPRAAATFPDAVQQAAAIVSYFAPGLRFFHAGQFEGRTVHVPTHLCRAPVEAENAGLRAFYDQLLPVLDSAVVRRGAWRTIDCHPAWDGNDSFRGMIAYALCDDDAGDRLIVVVNYAPTAGQCRLPVPFADLGGKRWSLADRMSGETYGRDGWELVSPGLYVDLPAWGHHVLGIGEDT